MTVFMRTQNSMGVPQEPFLETTHVILTDSKQDPTGGDIAGMWEFAFP